MSLVQWLRLYTPTAGGTGSIPGWGTKIPHPTCRMVQPAAKKVSTWLCQLSPGGQNHPWLKPLVQRVHCWRGRGWGRRECRPKDWVGKYLICNLLSNCKCSKMFTIGDTRWQVYVLFIWLFCQLSIDWFKKKKKKRIQLGIFCLQHPKGPLTGASCTAFFQVPFSWVPALGELLHPPREDSFLISLTPLLPPSILLPYLTPRFLEHTDLSVLHTHLWKE